MNDRDCVELLQWAAPWLGLRWRGFARVRGQVCKRISRRIQALGLPDVAAYRSRLQEDPREWQVLDALCRVTISRLYRDRVVWDALVTELLPQRAHAAVARGAPLRCWSAGCASGEEPWTLALALRFGVSPQIPGLCWEVLATDADAALISRAERACYGPSTLRELPRDWIGLAFEQQGDELCLRSAMREGVTFEVADVRDEPPIRDLDLLLCRNIVFTYLARDVQTERLEVMLATLRPGALLVIGAHESLPDGAETRFGLQRVHTLPIFVVPRPASDRERNGAPMLHGDMHARSTPVREAVRWRRDVFLLNVVERTAL